MNLVGRKPTVEEIQLVNAQSEEGFSAVIDGLLEEDRFYDRLKEIYTPKAVYLKA